MRFAFCDDDQSERQALSDMLARWSEDYRQPVQLETFETGDALLRADLIRPFDAAFLDVLMPGIGGIETARTLRARRLRLPIVFLTGSADYYAYGFEVEACHYILKPIDRVKLDEVMRRLCRLLPREDALLVLPVDKSEKRIPQHSIRYVETMRNGVMVHFGDKSIAARYPLSAVLEQLDPLKFIQCHRFYIVNLDYIEDEDDECFILRDGTRLLIRKEGRREIKDAYRRYFLAKMRGNA